MESSGRTYGEAGCRSAEAKHPVVAILRRLGRSPASRYEKLVCGRRGEVYRGVGHAKREVIADHTETMRD